jgi:proline iminopeptidase
MDPIGMAAMARALPRGRHLHCPEGSHMAMYDDQTVYMAGLLDFLRDVTRATSG